MLAAGLTDLWQIVLVYALAVGAAAGVAVAVLVLAGCWGWSRWRDSRTDWMGRPWSRLWSWWVCRQLMAYVHMQSPTRVVNPEAWRNFDASE